jgi:uncharacterized membrane protein YeaQ/YmgE (transglycosylase-associated protein family)
MADQQDAKAQNRFFFGGLIIGLIIGVLGNLAVTSVFELLHFFGIDKKLDYPLWIGCAFIGSIILLVFFGYMAWEELNKNQ